MPRNAAGIFPALTAAGSVCAVLMTVRKVTFILLFREETTFIAIIRYHSGILLPATVLSGKKFIMFTGYNRPLMR